MEEFRVCPACNYGLGFHMSFQKTDGQFKIIFICPNCGASFDIGLREARIDKLAPQRGADYSK